MDKDNNFLSALHISSSNLTTSRRRNATSWKPSARQSKETQAFLQAFPTIGKVYEWFVPTNWDYHTTRKIQCAAEPCVLLAHVDKVYNVKGAAKAIVMRQMAGIYTMAMAKDLYNPAVLETAAATFVASYGSQCSLYAMMCYFGEYLTKYKQTAALFDISDILRSYKTKFAETWSKYQDQAKVTEQATDADHPKGKPAMYDYLRREYLANGRSIRESALYQMGCVTEEDEAFLNSLPKDIL